MTDTSPEPASETSRTAGAINSFSDDALGQHDAVGLADLIEQGAISAVEATDAAIARAELVEGSIGAFAVADFDRAREHAAKGAAGRFAGVPGCVKDQTAVAGLVTAFGSKSMSGSTPALASAPMAKIFEDMGMVNLGKSTCPEYGLTSSSAFLHGAPTRNPWNLERTAGGSSSGAGALVAAGVIPMAHGGDGGGSIRVPAAACGVVGLKPSRGRLPLESDGGPMPITISVYGVLTRTVRDQCAFFAAAEDVHTSDPSLAPIGLVDRPIDRPLRIGLLTSSPANQNPAESTVATVNDTAALLESLGHEVTAMSNLLTEQWVDDFILYWSSLALVLRTAGKKVLHPDFDRDGLGPFTVGLTGHAQRNAHRLPGALRRLKATPQSYHEQLGSMDVIISPTLSDVAPPLDHMGPDVQWDTHMERLSHWASYTAVHNVAGAPAITLPLGHDEPTNLPIGVHFASRVGTERLLLELALQVEQASTFRLNM